MTVSVLVPFRAKPGSDRDRIWAWLKQRWQQTLPDFELVIRSDNGDDPDRFNEGQALNAAATAATGETFVITEAELAFNAADLRAAVEHVEAGGGWCLPAAYHALTAQHTDRLLQEPPDALIEQTTRPARAWLGESLAPIIVVPRDAYWLVAGWDDRYPGWGWTDKAFAWALSTLWQPPHRFPGSVFHLWHGRGNDRDSNPELSARYRAARGDETAMQALIDERAAVA